MRRRGGMSYLISTNNFNSLVMLVTSSLRLLIFFKFGSVKVIWGGILLEDAKVRNLVFVIRMDVGFVIRKHWKIILHILNFRNKINFTLVRLKSVLSNWRTILFLVLQLMIWPRLWRGWCSFPLKFNLISRDDNFTAP
jgi:hypothetical protein